MKEEYKKIELEIICFAQEDVITTSGDGDNIHDNEGDRVPI
jgi:hypothetical protein